MIISPAGEIPVDEKPCRRSRMHEGFAGAVTFEASEKNGGPCLRPLRLFGEIRRSNPTTETGKIVARPSVPFAIVRQTAKVVNADGSPLTEFDMQIQDTGLNQLIASSAPSRPRGAQKDGVAREGRPGEGFKAGRVGNGHRGGAGLGRAQACASHWSTKPMPS